MDKRYTIKLRKPEKNIDDVKLIGSGAALDTKTMWVGTPQEIKAVLDSGKCPPRIYFSCCERDEKLKKYAEGKDAVIRLYDMPLLELYEKLLREKMMHIKWALILQEATVRNYNMRDVITACAKLIEGSAFFIDKNYRVSYMGGSQCLESRLAKELLEEGVMKAERLKTTMEKLPQDNISVRTLSNGEFCWSGKVELENTEPFMVLLFTADDSLRQDMGLLFSMLIQAFQSINLHRKHGDIPFGDFKELMNNIISGKMTGWDEIDAYMKRLPDPPKRYISIGVVEANPSLRRTSVNALVSKLKTLFPACSAAQVGDFVILMISSDTKEHQPKPRFNTEAMTTILTEYDAHLAFANATQRLDMLRTEYLLAESTLKLGRALKEQGTDRIFYYEDYSEYIYIDLLMERFRELMVHDDLLFLTSPDAVEIYRYDQAHGTDLQLVLYHYCKNNGNISAAAKDAYMHRNTFAARMSQIREILKNVDLTDGRVQQRMLSSCRVFRYYNFYYDKKSAKSLSERLSVTQDK